MSEDSDCCCYMRSDLADRRGTVMVQRYKKLSICDIRQIAYLWAKVDAAIVCGRQRDRSRR